VAAARGQVEVGFTRLLPPSPLPPSPAFKPCSSYRSVPCRHRPLGSDQDSPSPDLQPQRPDLLVLDGCCGGRPFISDTVSPVRSPWPVQRRPRPRQRWRRGGLADVPRGGRPSIPSGDPPSPTQLPWLGLTRGGHPVPGGRCYGGLILLNGAGARGGLTDVQCHAGYTDCPPPSCVRLRPPPPAGAAGFRPASTVPCRPAARHGPLFGGFGRGRSLRSSSLRVDALFIHLRHGIISS
jgi:hypothetical protein